MLLIPVSSPGTSWYLFEKILFLCVNLHLLIIICYNEVKIFSFIFILAYLSYINLNLSIAELSKEIDEPFFMKIERVLNGMISLTLLILSIIDIFDKRFKKSTILLHLMALCLMLYSPDKYCLLFYTLCHMVSLPELHKIK